jgi:hypothetical protein
MIARSLLGNDVRRERKATYELGVRTVVGQTNMEIQRAMRLIGYNVIIKDRQSVGQGVRDETWKNSAGRP